MIDGPRTIKQRVRDAWPIRSAQVEALVLRRRAAIWFHRLILFGWLWDLAGWLLGITE